MKSLKILLILSLAASLASCGSQSTNTIPSGATQPATALPPQTGSPAVLIAPPTCASTGVNCIIGDTGPGGGKVFFDAGETKWWGRYLEVAPAGWSGQKEDPLATWCSDTKSLISDAISDSIGRGNANTNGMLAFGCTGSAANLASNYRGGGLADWYLPTANEVAEASILGGFAGSNYWSSSQYDAPSAAEFDGEGSCAIEVGFGESDPGLCTPKEEAARVRPIRAF